MKIKDNFLAKKDLTELDNLVHNNFPWYLHKEQVTGADDGHWFGHIIYNEDVPKSDLYNPMIKIFKNYLKYVTLIRIHINLLVRQETPSISDFHTDCDFSPEDTEKITTAIFYMNTCNGVTEFEDQKIDTIRNRLIMFPANTLHRAIGQTDTNERIVFNFNFIKENA
jgi:hypothetical protein